MSTYRDARNQAHPTKTNTLSLGIICVLVLVITMQVWLLTAALNESLEGDNAVTVIGKDHVLATLTEDVNFDMELTIGKGRGYRTSQENSVEADGPQDLGAIAVDSEVGKGTAFTIALRRASTARSARNVGSVPANAPAIAELTIVLVDDEDDVRSVMKSVLCQQGYTVLDAASGADAIRLLADHSGPIDMLVTDVLMPGMTGRELYEHLAHRHHGVIGRQEPRPHVSPARGAGELDDNRALCGREEARFRSGDRANMQHPLDCENRRGKAGQPRRQRR